MRRSVLLAAVVILGGYFAAVALASPKRVATAVSDGGAVLFLVSDGGSAAADLEPGAEYVLRCDAATKFRGCASSVGCTAVSDDYPTPAATGLFVIQGRSDRAMSMVPNSGGATCGLFKNDPRMVPVIR